MSNIEHLVEDYATVPVPESKTVSGWHLALIIIGVSIAIPSFIAGAELGTALGALDAFWSFLAGGLILAVIGSLTAAIAVRTRLSTYMLARFCFGSGGANVVNLVLAATIFGWFGVNAQQFGEAVYSIFVSYYGDSPDTSVWVVVGAGLMICTAIFGFKALDKLALAAVPVLLVMLVAVLWIAMSQAGPDAGGQLAGHGGMTPGLAISAVVGAEIVAVAVMPDLARYVRNNRHSVFAMILSFMVAAPLIYISAAVPAMLTGEVKPMLVISALGLGAYTLFAVILSTWTTNTNNLYSASLSVSAIFRKVRPWKNTVAIGVLGTLFALSGAADRFIDFLLVLGVAIPPVVGILIVDYFFVQPREYRADRLEGCEKYSTPALCSWLLGCAIAYLTTYHPVLLSRIPACDGLLIGGAVYWVLKLLAARKDGRSSHLESSRPAGDKRDG